MTALLTTTITLRAGADPPRSLVERALSRAALDGRGAEERRIAAAYLPRLRLAAGVAHSREPQRTRWAVEVLAQLSWPLDAVATGDARSRIGRSMRAAQRREELVEALGVAWRRRESLRARAPRSIESRLDFEEADAELAALTGDQP